MLRRLISPSSGKSPMCYGYVLLACKVKLVISSLFFFPTRTEVWHLILNKIMWNMTMKQWSEVILLFTCCGPKAIGCITTNRYFTNEFKSQHPVVIKVYDAVGVFQWNIFFCLVGGLTGEILFPKSSSKSSSLGLKQSSFMPRSTKLHMLWGGPGFWPLGIQ